MPIRLLFLNTRDECGADVGVHLSLMANFTPEEVRIFVISNSEAAQADEMRDRLSRLPHVTSVFLPLGKPSEALAKKGKLGKALAYGPSIASLVKALAFIRKHRIQIIHSTDRPRDASYSSLLGRLSRVTSVVHMHAPVSELSAPTIWGMRNAKAVFAVSEDVRVRLIALGLNGDKIHTIYDAVDTDHFDPDRKPGYPPIRERFGIPRTAPLLGIAARMIPWKGQRELIGAAAMLRSTFPDLHVMILGKDDKPEVRADFETRAREGGIADRVHFGGLQRDVRPFLNDFDLFVHPSYCEPFGLAIVEAMAMRKPVIACGTGGVPEIITHGQDGWLVEERSEAEVAAGITRLLQDGELRRSMGERARRTVRERFSPRQQCAAVMQRYTDLISVA